MAARQSASASKKPRPRARKYFTLGEANRTLPLVQRIARDIVEMHHLASEAQAMLEGSPSVKEAIGIQGALDAAVDRLHDYEQELTDIGCELKDYETGLIDYPGRHKGREICLCWRLGEERIAHWHEANAGAAGRQSAALLDDSD